MSDPYYQDDLVTLYHGDCIDLADVWTGADVLVTDPPYGIGWEHHGGGVGKKTKTTKHSGIQNDHNTEARDKMLEAWGDQPGMVFGSWRAAFPRRAQTLIWQKPADAGVVGSVTGFRNDTELIFLTGEWPRRNNVSSSVFRTGGGMRAYLNGHPHAKPVTLLEELLRHCPSGSVADPFAGSGSTLVAAANQGRKAIGVEYEERYCEMIAKRLSSQTMTLDLGNAA